MTETSLIDMTYNPKTFKSITAKEFGTDPSSSKSNSIAKRDEDKTTVFK